MKYLIIDTETSGLFDFSQPADAPGQPRLAAFASIGLAGPQGPEQNAVCRYVKPDGWRMAPEAGAINRLTDRFLWGHGEPVAAILESYSRAIYGGAVIVAYNAQFDTKIMRAEMRLAGMPDLFEQTANICLMKAMKAHMGIKGWRHPKLKDAAAFVGHDLDNEHDALADARAALAIFRYLHANDALPEPSVKYAKRRPGAA